MVVLVNRAKMSTATTGTGTITLGTAEDGYQTLADAGVTDGDTVRYVIEDDSNWEIGTGTYTASGTTLSRTVSESSNGGAEINLSGFASVFVGATSEDIQQTFYASTAFTAADGQTDFSVNYTVGYIEVFLNGVKLVADTDFFASDGTSVVLTSGTTLNDIVEVIAYATVSVGDAIPSSGGTFSGAVAFSSGLTSNGPLNLGAQVDETVFVLSGTTVALDPSNGTIQTQTLSGNTTYTDSFSEGESITLMVNDGSGFTVTGPTIVWVNNAGEAPTLATSGYTVIVIWKVSTILYGALTGDGT